VRNGFWQSQSHEGFKLRSPRVMVEGAHAGLLEVREGWSLGGGGGEGGGLGRRPRVG
jgi:hypothetical protein